MHDLSLSDDEIQMIRALKGRPRFAVFFRCEEAINTNLNEVVTEEGTTCWVIPEEWVAASALRGTKDNIPLYVKIWGSRDEADKFMSTWGGHPWYFVPKNFEVVELDAHIKPVVEKYKLKESPHTVNYSVRDKPRFTLSNYGNTWHAACLEGKWSRSGQNKEEVLQSAWDAFWRDDNKKRNKKRASV